MVRLPCGSSSSCAIRNRKRLLIYFLLAILVYLMLVLQMPNAPNQMIMENLAYTLNADIKLLLGNVSALTFLYNNSQHKYLVKNSKCKIPDLDPFNSEVIPLFKLNKDISCTYRPLLTYLTKKNNVATLHLDERSKNYYGRGIHCCFSYILRGETDDDIYKDWCIEFKDKVVLKHGTLYVICLDGNANKVYENVHTTIIIDEKVERKLQQQKNEQPLSVFIVAIDGVSKLNFRRSLPKTQAFLNENNWFDFIGYNKIESGTFDNLMAILTGFDPQAASICDPTIAGRLDNCSLIWYDYRKLGFITAYAEDLRFVSTFNWKKEGFVQEPTDYYLRPYIYGFEKYLDDIKIDGAAYCSGPENTGDRLFNVARDFSSTFQNYSTFSIFWMNSYSHNDINTLSRMDDRILRFLNNIKADKIIDNSVVVFLSDHGCSWGNLSYTHAGWIEGRLPFFYMSLPSWFKQKYPEKHTNLGRNTKKLTTPYDLHMTLQEILALSGKNYTVKKSAGCPNCKSLFSEIETERSCVDAGIPIHYCTCTGYFFISPKSLLAHEGAKFMISEIHKTIVNTGGNFDMCVSFKLNEIISAGISDNIHLKNQDKAYLLVSFRTYPEAIFQGTVSINLNTSISTFGIMQGNINRLDEYKYTSGCAEHATLKQYCYCGGNWNYVFKSLKKRIIELF